MRPIATCGLALAWLVGALLLPAGAQTACTGGANVLGVSRTVEIDTTTGPRFGFQYHEQNFLNDGEVVLTFDDGPLRAYTKPVLEALAAQCTKATFFVVGRMAVADPEMVKEYARRGHTIGTHTWSHANLASLTPLKARAEIELGFSAVQRALGKPVAPFFRFPYLAYSGSMAAHLQNRHIATFSIDIDSKDYRTHDPEAVHKKIMAELMHARKGIILFHDIQPSTAKALPGLLAEMKAKGFRIVHMVPKASVVTASEFDEVAQKEFDKRLVAGGALLLKRAMPVTATPDVMPDPAIASQGSETLLGQTSHKPVDPLQRPLPRILQEEDWKSRLWRSY